MKNLWLCIAFSAVCSATNIVQNPGFESGTANWTFSGWNTTSSPVHSGTQSADTGCVGSACVVPGSGAFISQSLGTVTGQNYDLSFWVTESGGPTSEILVRWNGSTVADILNPNNNGANNWRQLSFTNLAATSTSTLLEVYGRQDPAGIYVDDFIVDSSVASTVPEPGTFLLAGLALAAVSTLRRR
jgi:hypothetical protein